LPSRWEDGARLARRRAARDAGPRRCRQQVLDDARRRDDAPARIGGLLHRSWQVKKRLSSQITAPGIDDLYEFCLAIGAVGGKLCGAGGGGFLLMVVPPERRADLEPRVRPPS
jgi:galactokinase/mevalonate kinase-like predicted kinase